MATAAMRISRERKALLSQYATAAVNLYGVISVPEFVDVFNHYETVKTSQEEIELALRRVARTDDVEYSLHNNILTGPEFQPDFDDYEENVADIRECQKGKPRYLPDKNEFLRYEDCLYFEPKKPYEDLKAYILKHKLTDNGEGLDGIDGDLIDLREMIQSDADVRDYMDYFTEAGYVFSDLSELREFVQMITIVSNNTRIYENSGFTPHELSQNKWF